MSPTPVTPPKPDFKAMWRNLRAGGMSPDQANDLVHEHMRRYSLAQQPDTPEQNPVATALTQFGNGASFGFAGDPAYLAEGEAANPGTATWANRAGFVAGGTAALGNPAALAAMAGMSPAGAAAVGGAAIGGLEAAGHSENLGDAAINAPVGAAVGAFGGAVGGKILGKFVPTGQRLAANIARLLTRNNSTLPGLQSVAYMIGSEAANTAARPDVSVSDVEELAHILRGEPTMPGFQTASAWIGSEAAPAMAGRAPTVLSEADVLQNIREATMMSLREKLIEAGVKAPAAEATAQRAVRLAGAQAQREVRTASMPVAQGSTPVMQLKVAPAPQIKPEVDAAVANRAQQAASQLQAAEEVRQARAAATRGTPTPAQAEAAQASPAAGSGSPSGPGMGRPVADYAKPPEPGASMSATELRARSRIIMKQGFSQSDAEEMARSGTQVPRDQLQRLLGKRFPGTQKWI